MQELSEEVVGTILTRLERTCNTQWVRLISCLHNRVSIGFHKRNPKILAQTSPVIRALLEQNNWIQRSATREAFDHELLSSSSSEYNAEQFAQLKQQKGTLDLDLAQAAIECQLDVNEVQRELVRLKAAGEISLVWANLSFLVQVLQWPSDCGGASNSKEEGEGSNVSVDMILDDLLSHLSIQETMSSEKLSIMAESLSIACMPSMNCSAAHAVKRAALYTRQVNRARNKRNKEQHQARFGRDASAAAAGEAHAEGASAAAASKMDESDPEEEEEEFFDLHRVMGQSGAEQRR
jgi:hypothetical protein